MKRLSLLLLLVLSASLSVRAEETLTRDEANKALQKAVTFFREKVSIEGGYLWRYAEDLSLREGEDKATATQAWTQPPGTPSVGDALLAAYERTGEKYLLDAAVDAARSLVKCQLCSGGWDYRMEYDPEARKAYAYRVDGPLRPKTRNNTTLDDDKTQSAIRFMMHIDRALGFKDPQIHEATQYALEGLLKAQFPNGAWSQQFSGPPKPEDFPVIKANYPDSWSRTFPAVNYSGYYTLNDNALADAMAALFEAAEIYQEQRYFDAAKRGGDFLILAQMPDPQPAWAQQYNAQMQPAWARKFEPPAVTGGESHGAMKILMDVYRQTGDKKYLEPIPRALAYLEKSALPNGRMARFYELKTNRPLYFNMKYELVYTSDDMPTHYGFITGNNLPRIRAEYEKLLATDPAKLKPQPKAPKYESSQALSASARAVIAALDSRGAWVESGRLRDADPDHKVSRVLTTPTFIRNIDTLSRFMAASK